MQLDYINNKLIIPKPTCDCTYHNNIDSDIYIGSNIIENLNSYISDRISGSKCLLITDNNLYDMFGQKILAILKKKYDVSLCIPKHTNHLTPNQYSIGEVLMSVDNDTDFLIALGSGTINDITRYVAFNCKLPFVSIGTAPSMDGYLSVVAPLLKDNLKINKPAKYPEVCVFDIDILKTAPMNMLFSGYGDVIGKYIAKADWILGNIINNEHICPFCLEIIDDAIKLCEDNINNIKEKNEKGVQALLESLLLTGLAMLLNGNSRPAASNEHNMSHFFEMKKLQSNKPHPSHGESVGVATLYCLDVYNKLLAYDYSKINISNILSNSISSIERENKILSAYGTIIGTAIIADNKDEPISLKEHQRRIETFLNNIDIIKEKMQFLPNRNNVSQLYKILQGATCAKDIDIDNTLLHSALLYAKDYRSRYNIFKLAEELGILEEVIN